MFGVGKPYKVNNTKFKFVCDGTCIPCICQNIVCYAYIMLYVYCHHCWVCRGNQYNQSHILMLYTSYTPWQLLVVLYCMGALKGADHDTNQLYHRK